LTKRALVIKMVAERRACGDVEKQKQITKELEKLSTELLMWLLDDQQREILKGIKDA